MFGKKEEITPEEHQQRVKCVLKVLQLEKKIENNEKLSDKENTELDLARGLLKKITGEDALHVIKRARSIILGLL